MKTSIYSTAWNLHLKHGFDPKDAFANWSIHADEISVAVGDEPSQMILQQAAHELGLTDEVRLTRVDYDLSGADSFAYGKTENAALQACTGDLLIQQNLDERLGASAERLVDLYQILQDNPEIGAFWVPTIDLYGDVTHCASDTCKAKWYVHRKGYKRGPVSFGIKPDGRPDYNKSSTDELTDENGSLVPTVRLLRDYTLPSIRAYVAAGWPLVYHLGFLSLVDRAERAGWWSAFWLRATGGDPNTHITDVEELKRRATFEHGLPLWPTIKA